MVALVSFLSVVTLSLILERVGTIALVLTGLSRDMAAFQARSAFTGTGFTTGEAEQVMGHPARRRIVMWLMSVRSFEVITGVSALVLTFISAGSPREQVWRGILLSIGLAALVLVASSGWVDRHLSRLITWILQRWTTLDVHDYTALLGLAAGHAVWEIQVAPTSWMANKRLNELDLPEEGITVLGIQHADGEFVGAPRRDMVIRPFDTLILYGRAERLVDLEKRQGGPSGDQAHRDAVSTQRSILQEQDQGAHTSLEREPNSQHLPVEL